MNEVKVERFQDDGEFSLLVECVKEIQPKTILEIGSLFGGTLKEWMQLLPAEGTLISIDKLVDEKDPRYGQQLRAHTTDWNEWAKYRNINFKLFEQSSHDPNVVIDIIKKFPPVDFLFIDGDHSFEAVSMDYSIYAPLVRVGGIVAFHDISFEKDSIYYGVKPLWEKLKSNHITKEFTFRDNFYGIGVLYV